MRDNDRRQPPYRMGNYNRKNSCPYKGRILIYLMAVVVCTTVTGQIHYSVPKEMAKGSFMGDVSKDLRMESKVLSYRGVRVVSRRGTQYFALNERSDHLNVNEMIDRERICGPISYCILNVKILLEHPLELNRIEIEIQDINDNAPRFPVEEILLK